MPSPVPFLSMLFWTDLLPLLLLLPVLPFSTATGTWVHLRESNGSLSVSGPLLLPHSAPIRANEAAHKWYIDEGVALAQTAAENAQTAAENAQVTADNALPKVGGTLTGPLSLPVGVPELDEHAVSKGYLLSVIANLTATIATLTGMCVCV